MDRFVDLTQTLPTGRPAPSSAIGVAPDRLVDLETYPAIVARDASLALAMAIRICRNRALAEEVVQDALFAAWRDRGSYDPARGSTRTWLMRIVHNRAIDTRRREHSRHGRDVNDDDAAARLPGTDCLESEILRRDLAVRVRRAVGEIPTEQRQALELTYFEGLTHLEAAQLLALAPGTVKGRIRLGLDKLRSSAELVLADQEPSPAAL